VKQVFIFTLRERNRLRVADNRMMKKVLRVSFEGGNSEGPGRTA
jgi:hypothetical protein